MTTLAIEDFMRGGNEWSREVTMALPTVSEDSLPERYAEVTCVQNGRRHLEALKGSQKPTQGALRLTTHERLVTL
jgi:hypothetical protein